MKSKILEKILVARENNSNENTNELINMINSILASDKFKIFDEIMSNVDEDFFVKDRIHGITHNERVAILSMYLGIKEDLSEEDLRVVLKAALYHDIGRVSGKGNEHGRLSAQILDDNKNKLASELDDFDLDVLKFLCTMHSNPDEEFVNIANEYELVESSDLRKMVNVLKDADALDRVRLPRFGKIDTNYLRTETAKTMVDTAKELFREYLDTQYELGITFDTSVFDIENWNVIEDEENYYVFRSLNNDNMEDLNNPERDTIRTKGQIAREKGETTRFSSDSPISLEEVYSNVRVARSSKETDCISFSSNANVNLDYDSENYIMYAIPKSGDSSVHIAGKYMLEEINKKVSQKLSSSQIDKEIIDIITQIDAETDSDGIKELVLQSLDKLHVRLEQKRYKSKKNDLISKKSISSRFEKKQFFSAKQEIEYYKVIAKLTVLELNGDLRNILPTQSNNATLLSALGGAFSSSEIIHYGAIDKKQISIVSKSNMELMAILQQAENIEGVNKETLNLLKLKVLQNVKAGKEITKTANTTLDSNLDYTDSNPERIIDYLTIDSKSKSIIPYYKGNIAVEYIKNMQSLNLKHLN